MSLPRGPIGKRLVVDARSVEGRVLVYVTVDESVRGPGDEDLHFLNSEPTLDEALQWAVVYMEITGIKEHPKIILDEAESPLIEEINAFLREEEGKRGDSGGDPF